MKSFVLTLMILVSSEVFACKILGEMNLSSAYITGVLHKLTSTKGFKNYKVIRLKNIKDNQYKIILKRKRIKKCLTLHLAARTKNLCKFTAELLKQEETGCPETESVSQTKL